MAETKTYEVVIRHVRARRWLVTTDQGEEWARQQVVYGYYGPSGIGESAPQEQQEAESTEVTVREVV